MTDLLQKLADLLRGRANRVLDELEDPKEQLALFLNDLNGQLSDLRSAVARAMADEKRLQLEIRDHLSKSADWERRAVLALEDGDEDLARQALIKREEEDERALALQTEWEVHQEATAKLKESLKDAKRHVDEARRKYSLSVTRYESAKARKGIADTLSARGTNSANELVEKLDEKIRTLEAETEVQMELTEASEGGAGSLESRFLELESRRKGDDALKQLKASLGERKALEASSSPSPERSRIDALKAKLDGS